MKKAIRHSQVGFKLFNSCFDGKIKKIIYTKELFSSITDLLLSHNVLTQICKLLWQWDLRLCHFYDFKQIRS